MRWARATRDAIRDELSDFLLHLAFQLVIAEERGEFTADDVADGLEQKMRRRHPAPLRPGDARAVGADQAAGAARADARRDPPTLPPLLMAYRLQERAASVGLRLARCRGAGAKVREELAEVEAELAAAASRAAGAPPADPEHARAGPERRD